MRKELPFDGGGNDDRGEKAASAFRTISEVADELGVPQHVLRFWETKFSQVRPLKRGGGRRYYRPEDIELLRRVKSLLYIEGYTIKGAQKLLRQATRSRTLPPLASEAPEPAPVVAVPPPPPPPPAPVGLGPEERRRLTGLRDELVAIRRLLD
ncbi:MAG: MerR family transcriptional regulator [Alphaproteobacteria bacterium]|nr:MerR family transcriptional regulator [Alphaproteobacteria bacterium]